MNWRDQLQARLLEIQPASVCALDPAARLLAGEVLPATPMRMHDPQTRSTDALALGIDVLNGLNAQQAQHRISQARLYVAPRILLAVQLGCALDAAAFRALGFVLSATDTANNMRIFHYDLESYKTVPDWLNARYWAHPERWEP
jgi:hypothetical protein